MLKKLRARNVAHAVGLGYSLGILTTPTTQQASDITDGQIRAFHGKLHELARRRHAPKNELKDEVLEQASVHFGRTITALHDMRSFELSHVLDQLEDAAVLADVRSAA